MGGSIYIVQLRAYPTKLHFATGNYCCFVPLPNAGGGKVDEQ
jgi:hypothetical protein